MLSRTGGSSWSAKHLQPSAIKGDLQRLKDDILKYQQRVSSATWGEWKTLYLESIYIHPSGTHATSAPGYGHRCWLPWSC